MSAVGRGFLVWGSDVARAILTSARGAGGGLNEQAHCLEGVSHDVFGLGVSL